MVLTFVGYILECDQRQKGKNALSFLLPSFPCIFTLAQQIIYEEAAVCVYFTCWIRHLSLKKIDIWVLLSFFLF